ncbi:2'-5' RNA ligase family protein [Dyella telluris]|uniref:2'-5' RNA ligase family protein n=1 Tax=Dyella telluris TaxID=2763498 RepID=A0A7G8Q5P7_9GAMM|nr:2'-5' RNA ligase family protein [Dyella telluris]QNK02105.1 2'-5' RNA ligase family protein [Dyella telluris]
MLFSDLQAGPSETLVADLRDYPEWHRGRRRYGVWVVPVQDADLLGYLETARAQLADLIHPSPRRQPHLTLYVCGFPGEGPLDDDFPASGLAQQQASLERFAGASCRLPLARPDSFASAAFVPVGDPMERLADWRRVLGQAAREIRQAAYVPHITLGLYRQCVPAAVVRERLAALDAPPLSMVVDEIQYVTFDARDQLGPLHTVHRITLDASSEVALPQA